jgi:P27 family predicted phage terminase small subunit
MDRETFETLCRVYHKMVVADTLLETEGLSVGRKDTSPGGQVQGRMFGESSRSIAGGIRKHPAFTLWKSYSEVYLKLLSHFGLSPASRGVRVQPKEGGKENGKDRFFK